MKVAKIGLCVALALSALAITARAAYLPLRADVQNDQPSATIVERGSNWIRFEVRLPGLELSQGTLEGRIWDRIEIAGGGYSSELGSPEIPNISRLIAIPASSGVRAEFAELETETIPNVELMPNQGDEPEVVASKGQAASFDMSAYSRNDFYPAQRVIIGEPAVMRGVRLVPVQMNPAQYNPVTKELRVVHRFQMTVYFEGQDLRNVPRRHVALSRSWAGLLQNKLINRDDLDVDELQVGSYLIVCENDPALLNNLNSFIDWKKRKGHAVTVQTFTAGASNSTIKTLIQTAYDTWPVPPEFVLLFGDTGGDYALPGWSPEGVDHPYSQLEGGDALADVAVGRLPAENANETFIMINKVLFYEKMPYTTNSQWFHQSVLTAGSGSGTSPIQTNRWIKTRMIWANYTRIDTMWYTMGGSIPLTISTAINNGVTYFNYRGYLGISGWDNSDIDALTNGRKLPFVTCLTCGTGGFDSDSNMEHFVSVGTPTTPQGAIGAIGTATWSTNTRCNNTVNVGIYAGLFDEDITQAGNALNRGKLELYNAYQANSSGNVNSFSLWNALAGDPGVDLFTGAIRFMTCDVPNTVSLGDNSLALTVTETGVGPLVDATVCAYKASQLQVVAQTDANGQVTLSLDGATAGNVKVTITKHNFNPIVDSLDVVQTAVAVGYYSHTIDDDNSGGSSGDNDGVINPTEAVQIPTVFKNYGSTTTATGISVTASETDAFATLSNATQTFPNMPPGGTGNSSGSFLLAVAPNCPNGHSVRLNFSTTSGQGAWDGLLDLNVASYEMAIRSATASGADTLLSPGETANFVLTVKNVGAKNAVSLTATMVSLDTLVTVNDGSAAFGTINMGSSGNCSANPFNLTALSGSPAGHWADLQVTFSANSGALQVDTISIKLGNKTIIDPQGPDEYGYYCFDNGDVGYAQAPVYSWVELDPAYGGTGTQLSINDPSEDQDMSVLATLPFTFRYYGQNVPQITVCSNGWMATTPDVSYTDFRNFPIPSATGPTGQIAPFWDDLLTWSSGHVFVQSDAANHRYIIEWSRLKNLGSPQPAETFEVMLYDPIYTSTPTGDGEIVFQYNSISEVVGNYDDNGYSTIGIESPDRLDGVEVVYWNTYTDVAAAHVQNGRAYKFTTALTQGGEPPVIGVNPTSLTINAPLNGSGSSPIAISNNGGSILSFSTAFAAAANGDAHLAVPGIPPEIDAHGGPDAFGYTWVDSDDPGGPAFNWVNISSSGTAITFPHNDSTSATLPLGFNFPFYGQTFSSFVVSANGWVSFTSHANAYNNTTLPNPSAPPNLLAGFWDDLDPLQAGAQVRYWSNNSDSLIVSFIAVPHWGSSVVGTYTFQTIITSAGTITYQYQTLTGDYTNCTVGIQNSDGTVGLQVAYNQTYLHNGLTVQFYHPFLHAVPSSGAVGAGQSQQVTVTAYSYGLAQGTYPATMVITCNDPVTPIVNVPITVVVGGGAPSPVDITMTPTAPPIEIPAIGGSFNFDVSLHNVSAAPQTFDGWISQILPDGTPQGPLLGPVNLTLTPGFTLTRNRNQNVPRSALPGVYTYIGHAGIYSTGVVWDSSYFNYTKLTTGDGALVTNWENWGESFDPWLAKPATQIPTAFALSGPYPNPFNPAAAISYQLPVFSHVSLRVYDTAGRLVAKLVDGWQAAGTYQVTMNGSNLASGLYLYQFRAGDYYASGKMVLMK